VEKTTRELQSEQTRDRIIETAMNLFVRKGFFGASISDLASAVNMTKGALYHHFENKDALFLAVVEKIKHTWMRIVGREAMRPSGTVARLEAILDRHVQLIEQNEAFCLVLSGLLTEMDGIDPAVREAVQGVYADLVIFIERIVREGQAAGQIRPDVDARLTAFSIVGVLRGTGCSYAVFQRLGANYSALMETAKMVLIAGLKP
jgi:AcrR family transcriptional regulator